MSVVGVSPSDFVLVLRWIREIHNYYVHGPRKLENIKESLQDLEAQAGSVQAILEVANVEDCPQFKGLKRLRHDLTDALNFLKNYSSLSPLPNVVDRLRSAASLKWKERTISDLVQTINDHRARMESYKTLLVLHALYKNHQAKAQTSTQGDVVADDEDTRALRHAIWTIEQRRLGNASSAKPNTVPTSPISLRSDTSTLVNRLSTTDNIYRRMCNRAEALQLHYRGGTPDDHPEAWSEIIRLATSLSEPDGRGSVCDTAAFIGPLSTNSSGESPSNTAATYPTPQICVASPAFYELEASLPQTSVVLGESIVPDVRESWSSDLPAPLIVDESRSSLMSRQRIFLGDKVQVQYGSQQRPHTETWIDADLAISKDGDTTYVWAVPIAQAHSNWPGALGLAPRDVLQTSTRVRSDVGDGYPPALKHTLCSRHLPYPVAQHPAVESEHYDISFYSKQWVSIGDGSLQQRHSSYYRYRFKNEPDRNKLRSYIFGLKLLATAGYDHVDPAGACGMQRLTIWEHDTPGLGGREHIYLTLPCNWKGSETVPDGVLTFRVTGYSNRRSTRSRKIQLSIEYEPDSEFNGTKRRGSSGNIPTGFSTVSNRRSSLPASPFKIQHSDKCEITLSTRGSSSQRDKEELMRVLRERVGVERAVARPEID